MVRLYGALPLRRGELVAARWIEGLALALLSCLACVPVAALTGDWGGLMAGLVVICLSVALGLPLFLCLAPEQALWVWGLCLGAGAGALYGSTPLLAGPVTARAGARRPGCPVLPRPPGCLPGGGPPLVRAPGPLRPGRGRSKKK